MSSCRPRVCAAELSNMRYESWKLQVSNISCQQYEAARNSVESRQETMPTRPN